jgi:hypothetical protein
MKTKEQMPHLTLHQYRVYAKGQRTIRAIQRKQCSQSAAKKLASDCDKADEWMSW